MITFARVEYNITTSLIKEYNEKTDEYVYLDSKTEIINNEFGYNGEAHTVDGLQYLRSRYYNPETGVFISADSYRGEYSHPLSQNRYTYAHNNPYKYDDPTGHLPANGINKYAANVLMDGGGSGTSSNTTVKPLPKKTTSNVTTDDYRSTNIDEAHAGNQQSTYTILDETSQNLLANQLFDNKYAMNRGLDCSEIA